MPPSSDTDPDPERFRELMLAEEPNFDDLLECMFGITEPVSFHRVQELMHESLDEWTAFMHQQIDVVEETLEPSTQK